MNLRAISLAFFLASGMHVRAQVIPDKILFDPVSVPGNLRSALTEDIIQDPFGMLWVGSNVLYRYNGREFKKYNAIFPDTLGFSQREITKLLWDKVKNRLLISTRNYGILQYRYETDRLEKLPGKNAPIINEIAQTDDGTVWATSFTQGVFVLRNDTLVPWSVPNEVANPTGMNVNGNEIWIGCLRQVIVATRDKIKKTIPLTQYAEYINNAIRAHALHLDRQGRLWIGTERDGLIVIDSSSYGLIKKFSPNTRPFYSTITRIEEDETGLVWLLTRGDGIVLYSPEDDAYKHVIRNESETGSLSGDHCTSFCLDATGIVWIGATGALNKYDRSKIKFEHFNHQPNNPNSLSDDNIRHIYQSDDRTIFLSTSDGFINMISPDRKIEHVRVALTNKKGFISPLCLIPGPRDNFLVGTSVGLLEFDRKKRSFAFHPPLQKFTEGLSVRQIISHKGKFYLTCSGRLIVYDPSKKEVVVHTQATGVRNSSHVLVDYADRVWVGVSDGLAYLPTGGEKFSTIDLQGQKVRPDSSNFMTLSMQEIGDQLWVNSFNHGIFVFDHHANPPVLVKRITTENGLPENTVYATLPDADNNIWIAHNRGLSKLEPQTEKYTHFTVSEGLQDEEFNRMAYFRNEKGHIILGGINGINYFDPAKVTVENINTSIQLTGLRILTPSAKTEYFYLMTAPALRELSHEENSIQFDFFVPDFHEPIRYQTFYKLHPFEKNWTETDNLTSSAYANLPPGDYTFSVKATSLWGPQTERSVAFTILPPFWRTWWFRTLLVLAIAGATYGLIYRRTKSIEHARIRLETLLKIRTKEIERSREELRNLNKKKDLIFSILSHDLRSPLTTLKGFLSLLIENTDALSRDDLKKHASTIRHSVTNSLDLIDNTLYWSLSQTGNIQCNPSTVFLAPLFEKIRGLYQLTAEKKKIDLQFMHMDGLAVHADENMIYVLLRNLVSNALKFTMEGQCVQVDAMQQGALICIRVKDQGVGMSDLEVKKIFELDNPVVKKGTSSEKGTGLGLMLCKKFIELNRGQLLIESKEGEGSQFTVILPKA